jgi:D-3-phosphoglycerate dehydrogenase
MQLLANDIIPIPDDFIHMFDIQPVELEELLNGADFISLNCDLNPTSYHLINDSTLALARRDTVIINTARGPIIDEPALIRALETGQIAGAALDVFEDEPLPEDSPLKKMEQVMLAPHNSNSSPRAWERVHWLTIRNLLAGLDVPHDDLDEIQKQNS